VKLTTHLHLEPSAHVRSSLADFSTLKMETIYSSETSVHVRPTGHHIPEDGILHIKANFSLCLTNTMKAYGEWMYRSTFLYLGTSWR
jgi:hypothetical protein